MSKMIIKDHIYKSSVVSALLGVGFAFVNKSNDDRYQVNCICSCRDNIHGQVYSQIIKSPLPKEKYRIDTNKLRLLIFPSNEILLNNYELNLEVFKERLFAAKHVINMYETMAGWKKRSKIATVEHENLGTCWLITGPKEWMSSSHILSMFTLIIRVGVFYDKLPSKLDEVEKKFEEIIKNGPNTADYCTYLKNTYKMFPVLMKYYNKLFIDTLENSYIGYGFNGGIYALCSGNSLNINLNNRLINACKKEGIEPSTMLLNAI